ncbi:MAG: B12-binding domain-containing radical SAM protein [Nanoarchaeota archaeon]
MSDILLLNLNWINEQLNDKINNLSPLNPLELIYISCRLDQQGIKNDLIDLWALNKSIGEIKTRICGAKIILLTTAQSYQYWRESISIDFQKKNIKHIRRYNKTAKMILIGPQVTVQPEIFFEENIDFIVRGEPDLVAPRLVYNIINNKETYLPGVCIKKEGVWKHDNSFASVNNLSELPLLRYDKLKVEKYNYPDKPPRYNPKNVAIYEASRGCPNDCIFCFRVNFRDKFRKKSVRQIRKELKILKKCNIDYIYLIDENFGADQRWSKLVCNEFKKQNIKWQCQTRPELLNKEFIKFISDSGCLIVNIGLESTDEKILRFLNKSNISLSKFKESIVYMIKQNIQPTILFIIGSPYETKNTIKKSLDYILSFPLDKIFVYAKLMKPYPFTKMWELGLKENKNLVGFESVEENAGIIMNSFKNTTVIRKECVKFNNKVWYEQIKLRLKSNNKNDTMDYLKTIRYKTLIHFPWLDKPIAVGIYTSKKLWKKILRYKLF